MGVENGSHQPSWAVTGQEQSPLRHRAGHPLAGDADTQQQKHSSTCSQQPCMAPNYMLFRHGALTLGNPVLLLSHSSDVSQALEITSVYIL